MDLLSALIPAIARTGDLASRDVTSALKLKQESDFPLGEFPYPDRDISDVSGTQVLSDSFTFAIAQTMTNGALALNTNVGILAKGVWELYAYSHYVANYSQPGVVGLQISLNTAIIAQPKPLIQFQPFVGSANQQVTRRITIDTARYSFVVTLTNNGVGQTHSHTTIIGANRLL